MREQSISQSSYGHTVTLKCDRAYLYDVRDANTHYIRLYEGCEIYPRGKNIWRCQEILSREKENLLFANCISLSTQDFPGRFFFELHIINDIIILRHNCLNKKRCLLVFGLIFMMFNFYESLFISTLIFC